MTNRGATRIDRWLRAERLEQDVLALLGELGELDSAVRAIVTSVGAVNVGSYDHRRGAAFTPAQIAALYERNPVWAGIERSVYGDLQTGV
jgi:hypothetical protein